MMPMSELEARIAVLEATQRHLEGKVDRMSTKVDEMHEVLLQAKGAKWAILGVAGLAGFIAGKASFFLNLFTAKF